MENTNEKLQLEYLMKKLRKFFEYYCQWGEKLNTIILGYHKFIKLMEDCYLIDESLNKTRLGLIYKSENKNNTMNFNSFLNSLIKISTWKFNLDESVIINGDLNKQKALRKLIENYLIPRYEQIYSNVTINTSTIHRSRNTSKLKQDSLIQAKTTVNSIPNVDESIFDKNIMDIFIKVSPILFDIYKVYFPHEISLADDTKFIKEQSLKDFYNFLKDFDLYPGLVSKPLAFQIFQSEEEEKGSFDENSDNYLKLIQNVNLSNMVKYYTKNGNILGRCFNFFKFLRTILKISELGYENVEKAKNSSLGSEITNISLQGKTFNQSSCNFNFFYIPVYEKLILTVERMQLSEGFLNLQKKTSRTHSRKDSLMISKSLLETINTNNLNNENSILFDKGILTNRTEKSQFFQSHNNFEELCNYTAYINEMYGNHLLNIFKGFCSFGDPLNSQYMRSKVFMKLLIEANLINITTQNKLKYSLICKDKIEKKKPGLKVTDVDSLFIKLSSTSTYSTSTSSNFNSTKILSGNKIEYKTFLTAVEVIARMLFPNENPKKSIDIVVKDYILKHLSNYDEKVKEIDKKFTYLKELQKDKDFVSVLELVAKSFNYVYKHYANPKGLMSFSQLFKFMTDFGIFPGYLSKNKLNSFFNVVIENRSSKQLNLLVLIGYIQFVEVLALCAFELVFADPEPSALGKIVFFVERISQSEGPDIVIKSKACTNMARDESPDLLGPFKKAFPEYFAVAPKKKDEFLNIMLSGEY